MKVSQNCIDLVKYFEGCRFEAYLCPAGVWTIGFGNTLYPDGTMVKEGDTCTEEQAETWLEWELNKAAQFIDNHDLELNQNQTDACCSFIYNLGAGNFYKSTLFQLINRNPEDPLIEREFLKWVYVGKIVLPGLHRRRLAESHLYFFGILKFDWDV